MFFRKSRDAFKRIDSTYDIYNTCLIGAHTLKGLVDTISANNPQITEKELRSVFAPPFPHTRSGERYDWCNYKGIVKNWEEIQSHMHYILMTEMCSVLEDWVDAVVPFDKDKKKKSKGLQFPMSCKRKPTDMCWEDALKTFPKSNEMIDVYGQSTKACTAQYNQMESLLKYYRYLKELRNCYIHGGFKATDALISAMADCQTVKAGDLPPKIKFTPAIITVIKGDQVDVSPLDVCRFTQFVKLIIERYDYFLMETELGLSEFKDAWKHPNGVLPSNEGKKIKKLKHCMNSGLKVRGNDKAIKKLLLKTGFWPTI